MGKIKKALLIIAGIILVPVILVIFLPFILPPALSIFSRDIKPINDSDLQLKNVEIPDEENAHFDLMKLEGNIVEKIGDKSLIAEHAGGEIWNQEYVDELLNGNKKALNFFDEAVEKPKFQDPTFSSPEAFSYDAQIKSLSYIRRIAQISSIKSANLLKQEKDQEALEEAFKILEIGQKIQNSQGTLIHYLVAIAVKDIGFKRIQGIIESTKLSPAILIEYSKKFNDFKENPDWIKNGFKGEYLSQVKAIDYITSTTSIKSIIGSDNTEWLDTLSERVKNNSFYFKPNKTKALFADYARAQIENADKPCDLTTDVQTEIEKRMMPIRHDNQFLYFLSIYKLYFTENVVGKILHNVMAVSLSGVQNRSCQTDFFGSSNQLLMAIKAYKLEKGGYPNSLAALVPRYLFEIPQDPFDGRPFRYSRQKKIIYSVGEDLKDSGGSEGDIWADWGEMLDPTIKINF